MKNEMEAKKPCKSIHPPRANFKLFDLQERRIKQMFSKRKETNQ